MLIFFLLFMLIAGTVVFLCALPYIRRPSYTSNKFGLPKRESTFWNEVNCGIGRSFDFKGRCGRKEFWSTALLLALVWISFVFLAVWSAITESNGWVFYFMPIIWGFVVVSGLSLSVRRLHDLNLSGWWLIIGFTFGYFILLYLLIQPARGDYPSAEVF